MDNRTSPFLYEERPVPNKNQDRQTLNQVCQAETNMITTLLNQATKHSLIKLYVINLFSK